jgi:hypothetical protein
MAAMTNHTGRYAAVTSTLALVVALGGTSYAAATIGTADLKTNAVISSKIKNSSIVGADIATNTITGADVNESKLGRVPNADTAHYAADAGTVGGSTLQPVHTTQDTDDSGRPHFVFVSDALDIQVRCSDAAGGTVLLTATTTAAKATIASVVVNDQTPAKTLESDREDGSFSSGSGGFDLLAGDDGDLARVDFTYSDHGHLVQGSLVTDFVPLAGEPCTVDGYIISVG